MAAGARGASPVAHKGVWPEGALFNHSCVPNATRFAIGNRLIVRAGAAVAPGEEVTLSYFISQGSALKPAVERAPELMIGYGRRVAAVGRRGEPAGGAS